MDVFILARIGEAVMQARRELACARREMEAPDPLSGYRTNEPPPRSTKVRPSRIECDRLRYLTIPNRKIELQISTGNDQMCLEIHRSRLPRPTQLPRNRPRLQPSGSDQPINIQRQSVLDPMACFSGCPLRNHLALFCFFGFLKILLSTSGTP
jgi:hypothetical protein